MTTTKSNYTNKSDRIDRSDCVEISKSNIPGAGKGVFSTKKIKKGSFLSEYKGKWYTPKQFDKKTTDSEYVWEVLNSKLELIGYIDGKHRKYSNWTRYVNCPRNNKEWNVEAVNEDETINYYAKKDIKVGEELFVWYGEEYGKLLNCKIKG